MELCQSVVLAHDNGLLRPIHSLNRQQGPCKHGQGHILHHAVE